jgi:hypothetical protein
MSKTITTQTKCPVCENPLAGRGKCRSYTHAVADYLFP